MEFKEILNNTQSDNCYDERKQESDFDRNTMTHPSNMSEGASLTVVLYNVIEIFVQESLISQLFQLHGLSDACSNYVVSWIVQHKF